MSRTTAKAKAKKFREKSMYLDLEGIYFLLLALAVASIAVALWPTLTAPAKTVAGYVAFALGIVAAIVAVVD